MRGSPGLPTAAVATFDHDPMSTPPTSNGRASDGAQAPPAGTAPPHSIEAEQSVLGAILLSDRTLYALVIEEGLQPEDFYRERHREIYESMLELSRRGEPIDVLTVTEHLRSRGQLEDAGGQAEIDALTAPSPPSATCAATRRSSASTRSCAACSPRPTRSRPASTARGSAARARRAGRARDARGRPRRPPEGLPPGRRGPPRRDRQVAEALRRGPLAHRHAVRLRRPRRDHRRLPARQPDHHRRAPVDGKSALVTNIAENVALQPATSRGPSRCSASRCPRPSSPSASSPRRPRSRATTCARAACRTSASGSASCDTAERATTRRRCTSTTPPTSGSSRSAPRRAGCTSRRRPSTAASA